MKIVKGIFYSILSLIAFFYIVAFFLPKTSTMNYHIEIQAPADIVYTQVNSLKNWDHWSAFKDHMIDLKTTYEGPEQGLGSISKWTSKNENGEMTITKTEAFGLIETQFDFYENGKGNGKWIFTEEDGQTKVDWQFTALDLSYPAGRWVGLFFESIMEPVFTKSLKSLKTYCESKDAWIGVKESTFHSTPILYVNEQVKTKDINEFFTEAFESLGSFLSSSDAQMTGAPLAIYYSFDYEKPISVDACFPVSKAVEGKGEVQFKVMPETKVVSYDYYGSYDKTELGHHILEKYMKQFELKQNGAPWESYLSDPSSEPNQSKWLTRIYYPIK